MTKLKEAESFRGIYPDVSRNSIDYTPGVTNGMLEVADDKVASMLHFENVKDLDGERIKNQVYAKILVDAEKEMVKAVSHLKDDEFEEAKRKGR